MVEGKRGEGVEELIEIGGGRRGGFEVLVRLSVSSVQLYLQKGRKGKERWRSLCVLSDMLYIVDKCVSRLTFVVSKLKIVKVMW